jgi:hypothetical protein
MKKDLLYSATCLAFALMAGGAAYEHLNVIPAWSAALPASLSMFQGAHGLKLELFWMVIHPVNLLLFLFTLAAHWRSDRRKNIVAVLAGYIFVLLVTSLYFVPELISLITTPFSRTPDPELTRRASRWEVLSLVRLAVLLMLAVGLLLGLTKGNRLTAAPAKRTLKTA